jgi:hypothetical protein
VDGQKIFKTRLYFKFKGSQLFIVNIPHVVVVVVGLHPMSQVGSLRMCLDPDVVPPLAGFLLVAVLGVLHHILSVVSACNFL